MKDAKTRDRFITLRADGASLSKAAKELKIGKATAVAWDRELSGEISTLKQARLQELADKYGMAREARIKRLGDSLEKIEQAIGETDFLLIPPEKLLDLKLKYLQALKDEGRLVGTADAPKVSGGKPDEVVAVLGSVIDRIRSGEITEAQSRQEIAACLALVKAHETLETDKKVAELERLVNESR